MAEQRYGKFILFSKIGEGGMAEVFKAKLTGIEGFEKTLAIKRIHSRYSGNHEFIDMLIKEAKINVRLSHANIVQVYELGKVEESYYIAMEYVDGRDFRKIISEAARKGVRIPQAIALYMVGEVLKGLDYAHRRAEKGVKLDIVHRDVSPSNILVSYEGEVKILDFGIARAAGIFEETRAGILKGKIAYMSPEQRRGERLDRRSDIFSAGLLLFELLHLKNLFHGMDEGDIWMAFNRRDIDSILEIRSRTVEGPLYDILKVSLALDRDKRYRTAGEFYKEIVRVAGWEPGLSLKTGEFLRSLFGPGEAGKRDEEGLPAGRTLNGVDTRVLVEGRMDEKGDQEGEAAGAGAAGLPATSISAKRRIAAGSARRALPILAPLLAILFIGVLFLLPLREEGGDIEEGEGAVGPLQEIAPVEGGGGVVETSEEEEGAVRGTGAPAGQEERGAVEGTGDGVDETRDEKGTPPVVVKVQSPRAEKGGRRGKTGPEKARAPAPPPGAKGFLYINVEPWAYLSINGTSLKGEETPLYRYPLPEGNYRVNLSNPALGWEKEIGVIVEGEKETRVIMRIDDPSSWRDEFKP